MPIEGRLVAELERLSRIELTPGERERLSGELGRIIDYAGELKARDARGAPPVSPEEAGGAAGPAGSAVTVAPLRPDEPGRCLPREAALRAAPETDERKELYRVPRVIER